MQLTLNPPSLIFMVDSLPDGYAGVANGPIIRILKKYKDDKGLIEHEKTHVWQFWLCTVLGFIGLSILSRYNPQFTVALPLCTSVGGLLYQFVPSYRLWSEVQAYKKQLSFSTDRERHATLYGIFVATKYRLKISAEQATKLIKGN